MPKPEAKLPEEVIKQPQSIEENRVDRGPAISELNIRGLTPNNAEKLYDENPNCKTVEDLMEVHTEKIKQENISRTKRFLVGETYTGYKGNVDDLSLNGEYSYWDQEAAKKVLDDEYLEWSKANSEYDSLADAIEHADHINKVFPSGDISYAKISDKGDFIVANTMIPVSSNELTGLAKAAGVGFKSDTAEVGSAWYERPNGLRISPHDRYTEGGFDSKTTFFGFFKEFYKEHTGETLDLKQFEDRFWWGKRMVDFTLSGYFK